MTKQTAPQTAPLDPAPRVLMGPGPSDVSPRVLQAMAMPLLGHMDSSFLELMHETQAMLRHIFQTENELTLPVSGTGSAGMETCIVNLVEPGDTVLVGVNGVFGQRLADTATRAGADVKLLEKPWGEVFEPAELEKAIGESKPNVVALVHAETSTGALQPMEGISKIVREHGALLVADCVTSLGGVPVKLDEWDIDAAYSGTQKCLSAPPGLSPVSFGPRAVEKLEKRKTKVQSWYLDLSMVRKYVGSERSYHHTAPISMIYGLREACRIICEEGLEKRWQRHRKHHERLKDGLGRLGLEYTTHQDVTLPQLNAVRIPNGVDDAQVRGRLLEDYGIEIGGGLGDFKGKVWRIGLMGHTCRQKNVDLVLAALENTMK